jgi:uncharacterized protein (DUF58 family)
VLCGLVLGERDLMRAGLLAVAVPLAAALVVRRAQLRISNRRSVEPTRARAGEPVTVRLTITNRSALPTGSLMLEDRLPDRVPGRARFVLDPVRNREVRTVAYRIPGLGRGHYRVGPLRIRLTDPFHMIDLTRSFTTVSDFVVSPVVDPLGSTEPPRSYDGGENAGSHSVGVHGADDASTREYRIGDDLRKIHWKSSARTGALMVRQEERPWQGQATVVLDLRASAHVRSEHRDHGDHRLDDSLEWAVSAVASVGSALISAGRDVSLIADARRDDRSRFGSAARLVEHLAGVSETHKDSLADLAGTIRLATRDSVVVAVLGRLDGPSVDALADAHPRGWATPAFALLLDVDTWRDEPPARERPGRVPPVADVTAAAAILRRAGWRVAVVRRGDTTVQAWNSVLSGATRSVTVTR